MEIRDTMQHTTIYKTRLINNWYLVTVLFTTLQSSAVDHGHKELPLPNHSPGKFNHKADKDFAVCVNMQTVWFYILYNCQ